MAVHSLQLVERKGKYNSDASPSNALSYLGACFSMWLANGIAQECALKQLCAKSRRRAPKPSIKLLVIGLVHVSNHLLYNT